MGYKSEITTWLEQIDRLTQESDERVIGNIQPKKLDRSYKSLRTAAQALLSGKASRLNELDLSNNVPSSRWGSWIQGVPVLHAAMMNESFIVDLLPVRNEREFVREYRCTPAQFITILRRMRDARRPVYVNLRDHDGSTRTAATYAEAHEGIGSVLQALEEENFEGVYVNALRRDSVFGLFGHPDLLRRAEQEVRTFQEPQIKRLLEQDDPRQLLKAHPELAVRGGKPIVPNQAIMRIAYHLAFSELCSDASGGIPLDPDIAETMDEAERGKPLTRAALARMIDRATMLHHTFSAAITGAYGGTYNILEDELQVSKELWAITPIGDKRESQNSGFLDFAYNLHTGRIKVAKGLFRNVLEVAQPISLSQGNHIPTSNEIDLFFDHMQPVQQMLATQRDLKIALDKYIASGGDNVSTAKLERYIIAAEGHIKSSRTWRALLSRYGIVGGFGTITLAELAASGGTSSTFLAGMAGTNSTGLLIAIPAIAIAALLTGGKELLKDKFCEMLCHKDAEQQVLRLYGAGTN